MSPLPKERSSELRGGLGDSDDGLTLVGNDYFEVWPLVVLVVELYGCC